jgi:hypothetical protein
MPGRLRTRNNVMISDLLSQGIKNIAVVTYDELLARLKNYMSVLEKYAGPQNQQTEPSL